MRRSEHTVRVTAQLNNAVTGFHLWSQTYDRDLGDVLTLQTEIATAVAEALKVRLLSDISQRIEVGGTRNPAAFDAYLRGRGIEKGKFTAAELQEEIASYTEAIRLDPTYALAFAYRALASSGYASFYVPDPAVAQQTLAGALTDARTAVNLAPELAEGYYSLGVALRLGLIDFVQSSAAYERALALAPGNARILAVYSRNAAELGHSAAAIDVGRRAIALDPLNPSVYRIVGISLLLVRQYAEAGAAFQSAISLQPDNLRYHALLGGTQYALGAYEAAGKSCEVASTDQLGQVCLAETYHKLGRNADAEAMLRRIKSTWGSENAYMFAGIYAQWGDVGQALDWLERAVRVRDSGLAELKTDPDLDPLRSEPRFQAIERALKFPD